MSSLAVFLILGGATAFAAIKKVGANEIKANSIKTGKIVKEAVTAGKLKKGAVTETRIADGAVTTNKIANDAVTGDKVKESTLGTVPSATNALQLGGVGPAGYAKSQLEAVHLIGAPGQPAFESSCVNINPEFQLAGFYKDPFGIVHVDGDVTNCASETASVFTLPVGFRPTHFVRFVSHATDTTVGTIRIDPDGTVETFSNKKPILNGITFRTD
jgi:hypothetical protein